MRYFSWAVVGLSLFFLVALIVPASAQVTLWTLDFESNGGYTFTGATETSDGTEDYFGRAEDNGGDPNIVGVNGASSFDVDGWALGNVQGSYYFLAEDIDATGDADDPAGSLPSYITSNSFSIGGYSSLEFSVYLAEDEGSEPQWDDSDFVTFQYSIDGSGWQDMLCVESDGGGTNSSGGMIDTDCDGNGNSGNDLDETFQQFTASIPTTGTNMQVRVAIRLDSGEEDIAFDELEVTGILCSSGVVAGDIIITEIMHTPTASGMNDEWVEVYNTTGSSIDLDGWTITDGTNSHVISGTVNVASGAYAILNLENSSGICGGTAAYTASPGISWAFASNEEVQLYDDCGTLIDEVDYDDGSGGWDASVTGASLSLNDETTQDDTTNDDPANWCYSATTSCGTGFGTPGSANDACAGSCMATIYYSQMSGDWTAGNVWNSASDGSGCFRADISGIPEVDKESYNGTDYVIQSGHTITYDQSLHACNNLTINSGGKLFTNQTSATRALRVSGDITIDGTLGDAPNNDGISIEVDGTDVDLTGSGTADIWLVRKNENGGTSTFTFNMDANIRTSNVAGITCSQPSATLNVNFNSGTTVTLTRSSLSIDGSDGTNGATQTGTFTIDGTVDVAEDVFVRTDNGGSNDITYVVNGTLRVGGQLIGANGGVAGAAIAHFNLNDGATLEFYGDGTSGGNGTGPMPAIGDVWQSVDGSRDDFVLTSNSLVHYNLTTGAQDIEEEVTYGDLMVSGNGTSSSDKSAEGNINILGELTFDNARIDAENNYIHVRNSATGAVSGQNAGAYVYDGSLRRDITSGNYEFPVGTSANYELIVFSFSGENLTLDVDFNGTLPSPVDVMDGMMRYTELLDVGIWDATVTTGSLAGSYDVAMYATGYTNYLTPCSGFKDEVGWNGITATGTAQSCAEVGSEVQAGRAGLTSFSEFAIGVDGILPATLTTFQAKAVDHTTLLTWRTSSESGNRHFVVERSADGRTYAPLGQVPGAGDTDQPRDYRFVDERPLPGLNYYRLRQVDYSGAETFFGPAMVRFDDLAASAPVRIWPVPATDQLWVELNGPSETSWELEVWDVNGRLLLEQSLPEAGVTTALPTTSLPAGAYLLRWRNGTMAGRQRFVKR